MQGDKKAGGIAMILAKLKPGKDSRETLQRQDGVDGAEQDYEVGEDSAAEEIMEAIASKDKSKLKEALQSFIELCFHKLESEPHEEADESEQSEEE